MSQKFDPDFLDGLDGIFEPEEKKASASKPKNTLERRMQEINAFYEAHGREPAEDGSTAEYELYCSLEGFRNSEEKITKLADQDIHGLLLIKPKKPLSLEEILESDDPLFSDPYGLDSGPAEIDPSLLEESEERRNRERRITGEITERRKCEVFSVWKDAFAKLREDINSGRRRLIETSGTTRVEKGDSFIVDGQICTIADILEVWDEVGLPRKRLRIVIDNATEYEPYVESFSKSLWKDPAARRVSEPDGRMTPDGLFGIQPEPATPVKTGHVYAAKTLGQHPEGLAHKIIKIGRTKGDPARRVAGAADDPTFLRQPARLIRAWELTGYEPKDIEGALHAFFAEAAIELEMIDGFGKTVKIREWFDLDIELIEKALELILAKQISQHVYIHERREIIKK